MRRYTEKDIRYEQSPKGKARRYRYNHSAKGHARNDRYNHSEKHKACNFAFMIDHGDAKRLYDRLYQQHRRAN